MSSMVSKEQLAKANALRLLMAAYARSEDLIRIGAYQKNTDPVLDSAIRTCRHSTIFCSRSRMNSTSTSKLFSS
jgi:flagellum-specific ATP synthase